MVRGTKKKHKSKERESVGESAGLDRVFMAGTLKRGIGAETRRREGARWMSRGRGV